MPLPSLRDWWNDLLGGEPEESSYSDYSLPDAALAQKRAMVRAQHPPGVIRPHAADELEGMPTETVRRDLRERAMRGEQQANVDSPPYVSNQWWAGIMEQMAGSAEPAERWTAAERFQAELLARERRRAAAGQSLPIEDRRRDQESSPSRSVGDPRPWGREQSYPPELDGRNVDFMAPKDRAVVEGDMAWRDTYEPRPQPATATFSDEEWEDLREFGYEPTESPLVLRKRNPNGTVDYVHAAEVRSLPSWRQGEPGLNTEGSPFWREGRRDW